MWRDLGSLLFLDKDTTMSDNTLTRRLGEAICGHEQPHYSPEAAFATTLREMQRIHQRLAELNPRARRMREVAQEVGDPDAEAAWQRRWENIGAAMRALSEGEGGPPGHG